MVRPVEIEFPCKALEKHVAMLSPGEETIKSDDAVDPTERAEDNTRSYRGTTRPPHISSAKWQAMQYSERLKVGAEWKASQLKEAEERARASLDPLASTGFLPTHSHTDGVGQGGEVTKSAGDRSNTSAVAGSSTAPQPVILEYCCGPESKMGQVKDRCRVIRITRENADQSTPAGRAWASRMAQENPGALLWSSLPCTAGCPWWG